MADESTIRVEQEAESLAQLAEHETGTNAMLCYQCAKCSSGCPAVEHMDQMPNQVMRAVQLDDKAVLKSKSIWLCIGCQTCSTRCPQGIDIAGTMDSLRIEARKQGIEPTMPTVAMFNKLFLKNIELFGRLYEVGLMAGLNLVTGKPFANMGMGMGMIKRRKLAFLPSITRTPKKVEKIAADENTVAYYPGCSLHSTAPEFDSSIRGVAGALGLKLVEPEGWTCCGSSPAHGSDHMLATKLPVKNLAIVEQMGLNSVTAPCSACYARLKTAAAVATPENVAVQEAAKETGYQYKGSVEVKSLVETLIERAGAEKIAAAAKRSLKGKKVACYYGCLLTRPPKVTGSEHPEYPTQMEGVLKALGAEPIDWSYKTDCCGGSLGLTQTELALEMTRKVLTNAKECGADLVVTVCPLCHVNLDARQSTIEGLGFEIPVLYMTQLMGWAFGQGDELTGLTKNFVDPKTVLNG